MGSVVDTGLYTPTEIQHVSNSMTLHKVPISVALLGVEVLAGCWLSFLQQFVRCFPLLTASKLCSSHNTRH